MSESGKDCQAPTGPKPERTAAAASSPSFTSSTSTHLCFCPDILTRSLLPQNPPNTASLNPAMQPVLGMSTKENFPTVGVCSCLLTAGPASCLDGHNYPGPAPSSPMELQPRLALYSAGDWFQGREESFIPRKVSRSWSDRHHMDP